MENLEQNLKKYGVKDIKFYYNNCILVGNIFTVCLLFSDEGKILSRGVCIRSIIDLHNKKFARKKSMDRALKALFKKENSLEILPEINNSTRYYSIQKQFKIKTEETKNKLLEKANDLYLDYILHENIEKSKEYERLYVMIPHTYPIEVTKKYFHYKSEFKPNLTEDEKEMFKNLLK